QVQQLQPFAVGQALAYSGQLLEQGRFEVCRTHPAISSKLPWNTIIKGIRVGGKAWASATSWKRSWMRAWATAPTSSTWEMGARWPSIRHGTCGRCGEPYSGVG